MCAKSFTFRKEPAVEKKMTYVGLDVHDETIVAVWQKRGFRERTITVANDGEGLEGLLKAVGAGDVSAAYEASGAGFSLYDKLKKKGWDVIVVPPTAIPKSAKERKRKTDVEDARSLMKMLMAHGECDAKMPSVWVPSVKVRQDRELVRHRLRLAEDRARIKTQIKCLLKIHDVVSPGKADWSGRHVAWLRGLAGEEGRAWTFRRVLGSHLALLEVYGAEIADLDKALMKLSEEEAYAEQTEAVTKIRGVGLITALTFLLELGDVKRFKNRRALASYLGLTPASYESGKADDRKGHITKQGSGRLRKVLNQAAVAHVRTNDRPVWEWYENLKERRKGKIALVAVMRKLATLMWHRACDVVTETGSDGRP